MFLRSPRDRYSLAADLLIAAVPTAVWAIFLYGARAAVLMLLCGVCSFVLDIPVQKFLFRRPMAQAVSPFAFLTGVLTAFWFPVTVPLWFPMLAAVFVTVARSLFFYFGHRLFCPSVFSAALMGLIFPQYMERYTQPFAYFHALQWNIEPELVSAYQVRTPLDILQGGMMYEDGAFAQLYGFASGAMGAVAIACLLFGGVWLWYRRLLSLRASVGFLATLLVLAMAFAPEDVEMTAYGYLYLLSGGIAYAAVFAVNDLSAIPRTENGRLVFGILAAALTFVFRLLLGGEGVLYAVLACNLLTPLIELFTEPLDYYHSRRRDIVFQNKPIDPEIPPEEERDLPHEP